MDSCTPQITVGGVYFQAREYFQVDSTLVPEAFPHPVNKRTGYHSDTSRTTSPLLLTIGTFSYWSASDLSDEHGNNSIGNFLLRLERMRFSS